MSLADQFDPLDDLSRAPFAKPTELDAINLRVLTPFQRALLVIDGTVTKFIEAYTMEPVEIFRLAQTRCPVEDDDPWLEVASGADVAVRQVMIQGQYSGTLYVYAVSYVVLDRLSPEVRRRLEIQGEGLGRIFEDIRLETRREILWFGREHLTRLPEVLANRDQTDFISRAYRIITNGKPIALINERFPCALEKLPSHH